jgi:splicing factor 3B subunit 4
MSTRPQDDRNQEATVYLVSSILHCMNVNVTNSKGNLDERVTDAIVWELMLQAGPVGLSTFYYFLGPF